MEFVDEEKTLVEPDAEISEAFLSQINSKCAKYRGAVQKDKLKKTNLIQSLQKEFGDKILEEIETRKKSVTDEPLNAEEPIPDVPAEAATTELF